MTVLRLNRWDNSSGGESGMIEVEDLFINVAWQSYRGASNKHVVTWNVTGCIHGYLGA